MQLPLFFLAEIPGAAAEFELPEESSRHISAVLRMEEGEELHLTDGKGNLYTASIVKPHKKHTTIRISSKSVSEPPTHSYTIAIALLKNATRFEWFLEKATELGINRIVPLITARTEKQHYKEERSRAIIVSAMMQSGQNWLPELEAPQRIETFLSKFQSTSIDFFIAHCMDKPKVDLLTRLQSATRHRLIMIGPEGDFTEDELHAAIEKGAVPVSLGTSRLRAETAGIVAATLLNLVKPPLL